MVPAQIIQELRSNESDIPFKALNAAMDQREPVIPGLLGILEEVLDAPHPFAEDEAFSGHITALFLLAQFREARAFPLVQAFLHLAEELQDALLGDLITEGFPGLMASTCGGDAEALAAIAADPTLDPFIRGAGMDALLVLAFQGLLAQDRLAGCVATLFGQFEARGDEEDPTAWALLAGCAEEARLFALMPRLEEAFRRGRVDQDVITSGSIQKALELNPGHARRRFLQRHHLVEDAILELEALEYAWQREEIQAMLRERMSADGLPESALKYNLSAGSHAHPRVDPTTAALLGRSGLPDRPAV